MSTYHRFGPDDGLGSVIHAFPRVEVVSGSDGWRGTVGTSASISLYGGMRSRAPTAEISARPVYNLPAYTVEGALQRSGSYPATASIGFFRVVDDPDVTDDSSVRGQGTFRSLLRLYEYHGRYDPERTTGSYDYYSMFFRSGSRNIVAAGNSLALDGLGYDADTQPNTSSFSSFAIEAIIKPTATSSLDPGRRFTIVERAGCFAFYVDNSGSLVFDNVPASSSVTSPAGVLRQDRWQHVMFRYDSGTPSRTDSAVDGGARLFVDLREVSSLNSGSDWALVQNFPSLVRSPGTVTDPGPSLSVGNTFAGPVTGMNGHTVGTGAACSGSLSGSFAGFIHEVRVWSGFLPMSQVSASYRKTLFESGSYLTASLNAVTASNPIHPHLVAYYRMNQGPLVDLSSAVTGSGLLAYVVPSAGSGVVDHSTYGDHAHVAGDTDGHARPYWHPCDDQNFVTLKERVPLPVRTVKVFSVPSVFYGRQIATGSVKIVCREYSGDSVIRTLVDDGRGGLYISGSVCSGTVAGRESYAGVAWNKIGDVFYSEGIVVVRDPALIDIGDPADSFTAHPRDVLEFSFRGEQRIPSRVLMCRLGTGEGNASNNVTWSEVDVADGKLKTNGIRPVTYITAVGLYDSGRRLVGIAKLAGPVRKREKDKIDVRIRIDH